MNYSDPPSAGDGNLGSRTTKTPLAYHRRHGLALRARPRLSAEVRHVATHAVEQEHDTTGASSDIQGAKRLRPAADEIPRAG